MYRTQEVRHRETALDVVFRSGPQLIFELSIVQVHNLRNAMERLLGMKCWIWLNAMLLQRRETATFLLVISFVHRTRAFG